MSRQAFPFSAIVGQEEMKRALIWTAIDPTIGGVLIFGDRGHWKIYCNPCARRVVACDYGC